MLDAAALALRTVRATARAEGRPTDRVSIIGSSAGGHLASTLLTRFDAGSPDSPDPIARESSRPDLGLLCYPVIAMDESGHLGSQRNLLGENPSPELIATLSNDRQVTSTPPPCFIWHTATDSAVPVSNAVRFASALWHHHVECALHVFEHGRHGLGIPAANEPSAPWPKLALAWLHRHGHAPALA
jgi:acetyl esterase/lipase